MLTDAHCHPFDLSEAFPGAEEERRRLGVVCAASAADLTEFEYHEELARRALTAGAAPLLPCFAPHPQLPAAGGERGTEHALRDSLDTLETLARQGRLRAVGETGFDLFNAAYRETEKIQERLFSVCLQTALRHDLPLVLHARKAMRNIFAHAAALKKCRAVIFHSWPGTAGEGEALLRRGINVFFSFGSIILLNHREAMRCCAVFPAARLLTETDAPWQPPRGKDFSNWADLPRILEAAAALRREAGTEKTDAAALEQIIETNFHAAFEARQFS
jgi:TatD DNase family protein